MKQVIGVIGGELQAQTLVMGKDTVYIHKNIRVYNEEKKLFIYDEEQYSLNEFMNKLWQDNINLSLALTEVVGGL